MRFARHRTPQGPRLAVLDDEDVLIDLPEGLDLPALLADDGGPAAAADTALRAASPGVPLIDADLMAPLDPPTVRDFSTFPEHTAGIARNIDANAGVPEEFWEIPAFYFSNPYATAGPHDTIPVPPGCERFDFELEVAAVVGRPGRDLTVEQAAEHIAGFVVLNDFSARDVQFHEMRLRLGPAKGKDTATALGTVFVTADELLHRASGTSYDLTMRVLVNDEEIGTDQLDNMAWSFPALAAYASRGTEIRPGDLLGSGTCRNGCLAELWGRYGQDFHRPLRPGDVVTTEVELLGGTRNRVVPGSAPHPIRPGSRT
ncbi:fumarylacetoacetate hydrolase family protein [Saccharopolyspora dendranthemae]|uniref:2-keto-4-pentenoate hydratase/2-oxohepta-3-ene-1,7-dioic acid hydratase in catechol pathway n=1 Tax=Saccharopolyspora dendranthemae TaxID=1181886 RepID=A0A561U804_9PSEU|nr:fumarylacetoacetate hydrolase family protein [Saccharopolyspora dendranthemae]TWF95500.1 2-keto-4-pentenoate hydratase/2-oxohepta-3-ene-1,7-dioic acid hydratase in catechol pathway [Saccharopolyspora dendranthemae]